LLFTVTVNENAPAPVGVNVTVKVVELPMATVLETGAVAMTEAMFVPALALVPEMLSAWPPFRFEAVKVSIDETPNG
jgi:hypothetical protein